MGRIDVRPPIAGNEIGYAESTSDFATSSATGVDITGLTTGAVIVGNRPVEILGHVPAVLNSASGAFAGLYLYEDGVLITQTFYVSPAAGAAGNIYVLRRRLLTPGSSHTWKLQGSVTTGTATYKMAGNYGAGFISVKER